MSNELLIRGGGTPLILMALFMSFLFIHYGKKNGLHEKMSLVAALVWMSAFTFASVLADFTERFRTYPGQAFVDNGFRLGVVLVAAYFFWSDLSSTLKTKDELTGGV